MSHETYSFGAYTGIAEDNYNQQLKFDFGEKRLIKETVIKHYEETDTEGRRRIHKETKETKWFSDGGKHNPTISHHSEYL
jgi:hypothetical protein